MGLRNWVKRLERASREEMIEIPQEDGTVARFPASVIEECLVHEYERGKRHFLGEEPGEAHPFIEALRLCSSDAAFEELVRDQGRILRHFLGEDAIIRGETERPGPPVIETSPGHYE